MLSIGPATVPGVYETGRKPSTDTAGEKTMAAGTDASNRWWHLALWVVQIALAGLFAMAGWIKISQSPLELAQAVPYSMDVPLGLMRFIGAAELAGALGLILPALTRIRPALTSMAGVGLATIMVLATAFHIARGEWSALPITVLVGLAAAFVSWGRSRKVRIAPRG
jgi:uncharacterized membrane protein YphA (DoxX/SURF4 family)